MTEDEMVGWYHQLNGHEFEQTLGDGEGQGSLTCCSPWGCKESDMTEQLNNNKEVYSLHSTLRSMIRYELIFVKCIKSGFRFIFLSVDAQLFQDHLLKILSLPHCIAIALLSKTIVDCIYRCLFLGSLFCSIDLCILLPIPHLKL